MPTIRTRLLTALLLLPDLFQCDLFQCDLFQADLFQCDLFQADLFRCDLFQADLFRCDLFQAELFQANLFQADWFQPDWEALRPAASSRSLMTASLLLAWAMLSAVRPSSLCALTSAPARRSKTGMV